MNKLAVSSSVIFSSVSFSSKDPFGGQKSFDPNWTASMNPTGRNSDLGTWKVKQNIDKRAGEMITLT